MRHTHFSRLAILAGTVLISVLVAVGFATSAQAVDNGTLGIRPATESDFFHLSVSPGETLQATAIVSNYTTAPVTLLTYAVDGLTTAQGAFALEGQENVSQGVGLWSTVPSTSITVSAQSQLEVPITITVPANTTPGDYVGGLIIQEPLVTGDVANSADGTALRLDVIHRQGVRIYLNVSGTPVTQLQMGDLAWTQSGDVVTVSLPLTNAGNTTLHPTGDVAFSSLVGVNASSPFTIPESITPGATVVLRSEMNAATFIQLGRITATVESEAPAARASTPFVIIPWWSILGMAVVIGAGAYLVRRFVLFARKARRAIAREENAARHNDV
jgi:hypothetical protein